MKNITVAGDIIVDNYIRGNINRLNPEEPGAPLVTVSEIHNNVTYTLGGAANVAANIASLYGSSNLVGIHGNDAHASRLHEICKKYNIDLQGILWDAPTILKQRIMSGERQIARIDYEEIKQLTTDQINNVLSAIEKSNPEYIVLSDYNKGLVSKQSIPLLMNHFSNTTILVDAKPQNYNLFKGAYLIKSNCDEFEKFMAIKIEKSDDKMIAEQGIIASKMLDTNIIITRSEHGATLIHKDGNVEHIPTEARAVFDVTGAGDTFLAALVVSLAEGMDLSQAIRYGNKASAVVVGKVGTAVVKREEIT